MSCCVLLRLRLWFCGFRCLILVVVIVVYATRTEYFFCFVDESTSQPLFRCTCVAQTPLHLAALGGNLSIARELVAKGAVVDAVDADGMTAGGWMQRVPC